MEDLHIAATEIMDAIKQNDSSALAGALQNFFYICDAQPHEEDEDGMAYGGQVGNSGEEGNFGKTEQLMQAKYFGEKYR